MKKLTCHCGAVEAEVNVLDKFEKVLRCNCSVCKRKGYVMSPIGENDMKITKGEDKLTLSCFKTRISFIDNVNSSFSSNNFTLQVSFFC